MQTNAENSSFSQQPEQAQPNTAAGTPQYGNFGTPENAAGQQPSNAAVEGESMTNGGKAAPTVAFPEQRGSAPQNLDPATAREASDSEYDEQREGWAQDDPRYGSGTRNWDTNEPANRSTGPANDSDERPHNPNVGNNDNPDEFSAFRPDEGRGIPGSGK